MITVFIIWNKGHVILQGLPLWGRQMCDLCFICGFLPACTTWQMSQSEGESEGEREKSLETDWEREREGGGTDRQDQTDSLSSLVAGHSAQNADPLKLICCKGLKVAEVHFYNVETTFKGCSDTSAARR